MGLRAEVDVAESKTRESSTRLFPRPADPEWQVEIVPLTAPSDTIPAVNFEEATARPHVQLLPRVDLAASCRPAAQSGVVAGQPPNPLLATFRASTASVTPALLGTYGKSLENLERAVDAEALNAVYALSVIRQRLQAARSSSMCAQERYASEVRLDAGLVPVFLVSPASERSVERPASIHSGAYGGQRSHRQNQNPADIGA